MEQSVYFFLTKGAKIIIFNIQKGICGQTSMEKFKLENNNFGTFCACSCKLKCFFFFQSISSSLRLQSLYHFVWEALGFSLFVATRFLYVKLLGFFGFLESFSERFNLSSFRTVDIFLESHPHCLQRSNNPTESKWATFAMIFV